MKIAKWLAVALSAYIALVVAFESLLGWIQPPGPNTMTIVTLDASGGETARVVSKLESEGTLYVAANHWPRAWYNEALANPEVKVHTYEDDAENKAVQVTDAVHDRLNGEHPLGYKRVLLGFAPREFLRLDPR